MTDAQIVLAVLGFLVGLGLGLLNFRWFEKTTIGLFENGETKGVFKQTARAGIFRHVFVFLAGITFVWAAECPPIHLCGGLLTSVFVYRWRLWKRTVQSEGKSNK